MNKYMNLANEKALENVKNNFNDGGPFGAVIVKDDEIIASTNNTVLKDKDSTSHAEINAIKEACKKLNTHDLSGCVLYTTCYPCPMCMGAISWANINTVYYGNTEDDASKIGFKDSLVYKTIKNPKENLNIYQIDKEETIKAFEEFSKNPKLY